MIVAGGDVYWAGAHEELRAFAEAANVPVLANGLGRGLLPADHRLAFSRARSAALRGADLVVVAGTPLDFRLGFGSFGDARVVHLADAPSEIGTHASPTEAIGADLRATIGALAARPAPQQLRLRGARSFNETLAQSTCERNNCREGRHPNAIDAIESHHSGGQRFRGDHGEYPP